MPGVAHHQFEVTIIINAHRDIVVVLDPLFFGNASVSDVVNIAGVVNLKRVKELTKDLFLVLLSVNNVGMLGCIIYLPNVVNVDDSIVILVEDVESLHGPVFSERVHLSTHLAEELIVVDLAVTRSVHQGEQFSHLLLSKVETVVF